MTVLAMVGLGAAIRRSRRVAARSTGPAQYVAVVRKYDLDAAQARRWRVRRKALGME